MPLLLVVVRMCATNAAAVAGGGGEESRKEEGGGSACALLIHMNDIEWKELTDTKKKRILCTVTVVIGHSTSDFV